MIYQKSVCQMYRLSHVHLQNVPESFETQMVFTCHFITISSLGLIFSSSYHQAASLSIVLVMLLWESFPAKLKTQIQVQYQLKIKKPKAKLLTEQEFLDQSRIETAKALNELRSFCKSPKCDPWQVTSRLQSPSRFAEFVAGMSSITIYICRF